NVTRLARGGSVIDPGLVVTDIGQAMAKHDAGLAPSVQSHRAVREVGLHTWEPLCDGLPGNRDGARDGSLHRLGDLHCRDPGLRLGDQILEDVDMAVAPALIGMLPADEILHALWSPQRRDRAPVALSLRARELAQEPGLVLVDRGTYLLNGLALVR